MEHAAAVNNPDKLGFNSAKTSMTDDRSTSTWRLGFYAAGGALLTGSGDRADRGSAGSEFDAARGVARSVGVRDGCELRRAL